MLARVSRAEAIWLLRWATIALVVSSVPYALAVAVVPPGGHFLGLVPYAADGHTYLAKMLQGARGEWLYHLAFTPEDHPGALVFTFYLLLGHLAGWADIPMAVALQMARLFCGLAMLLTVYVAFARFTPMVAIRRTAFLLAAFSGGTGWLFFALGGAGWLGEVPVDVHFPDATTYWTLFTFPNYSFSVCLMLLMILLMLEAFRSGRWVYAGMAGLAGAALSATHPSILVVYAVLGAYWVFIWWANGRFPLRQAAYLVLMVAVSAPVIAYEYAMMLFNWAFRVWSEQNYCYSPSVANMVLSFGLSFGLALLGGLHLWRRGRRGAAARWTGNTEVAVPVLWCLLVPGLLYVPTSVQRRLLEGWHVALSFLVTIALVRWVVPMLTHRLRSIAGQARLRSATILNALLILATPSSILVTLVGVVLVLQAARPLYLYDDEMAALAWLRENSVPSQTVLAGLELGNIIPGQTGNRVVLGHWSETLYSQRKADEVVAFFNGATDEETRRSILERYDVCYVWYGAEEHSLGSFDPSSARYLEPVLRTQQVTLYRTRLP